MSGAYAFVFPGQGSQSAEMVVRMPAVDGVRRLMDAAEALSGLDLAGIVANGSAEDLADTRVAQPMLYIADWAYGTSLAGRGLVPAAVAGHSLGELAALAIAGVYSVEAGLELVVERSRLMAQCAAATPGGMLAVLGRDGRDVTAALDGVPGVWVANDNAPGQVVLSGTHAGLETATRRLSEAGARKLVPLKVAGPFHSPLMRPAAEAFARVLEGAVFTDAAVPVYQNADPTPATDAETLKRRLAVQITSPVRWTETMRALAASGVTAVIEAGPGSVLKGLARRVEELRAYSADESDPEWLIEEVTRS